MIASALPSPAASNVTATSFSNVVPSAGSADTLSGTGVPPVPPPPVPAVPLPPVPAVPLPPLPAALVVSSPQPVAATATASIAAKTNRVTKELRIFIVVYPLFTLFTRNTGAECVHFLGKIKGSSLKKTFNNASASRFFDVYPVTVALTSTPASSAVTQARSIRLRIVYICSAPRP